MRERWQNWARLESARPTRSLTPPDVVAVVGEVTRARAAGETVKMVGSGHSFTAIAVPEHTLLHPAGLTGVVAVDREAMTVTARAGTRLDDFNRSLEHLGLSLHNMGDIAEQTLAGAVSTGTHGTGGVAAGLAAQVVGLELVTGTGEVLRASATEHPEVLEMARVGLGALGVLTELTFAVEPLFALEARERPMRWEEALARYDELTAEHHHVDLYWWPHTDGLLVKTNTRLADLDDLRPVPRLQGWVDDELLANRVLGAGLAATNLAPRATPRFNRVVTGLVPDRTYSDVAHRVFTSHRGVVFREMEYAVPREAGLTALREARAAIEASGVRVGMPVEVRCAPADDIPLSTGSGRDSMYLAFHTHHRADHAAYFAAVETVMRAHEGRPHWGKLHTRQADGLAGLYPRFADFLAMRDRLDPDRVFANPYLRRVLGP